MIVFTLAASRLNSKVYLFSLGLSRLIHAAPWSSIKLQIVCCINRKGSYGKLTWGGTKNDVLRAVVQVWEQVPENG